jgi:hypothetical protein
MIFGPGVHRFGPFLCRERDPSCGISGAPEIFS